MNRSLYIIAIPAFIVSFCWLYYGWGLRAAIVTIALELIAAVAGIFYLRRRARRAVASATALPVGQASATRAGGGPVNHG